MKNLDKNISGRVVQFVDQASSGIAESAVTATKSLLGFNTATKEVTDSLVNLLEKQGNAALVKTDRVELAQKIQSVRLNEADPVRQEALIKQAMDAQAQAIADKFAYGKAWLGRVLNFYPAFKNPTGSEKSNISHQVHLEIRYLNSRGAIWKTSR